MIIPRKKVHILLILSELILIGVAITMIIIYKRTEDSHQIWMGSKILTIQNILKSNNNDTYPKTLIGDTGIFYAYKSKKNYDYFLKHSGTNCETNYKKCGILDTMGNIMCIPETEECPINDVIDEETYNRIENPEKYVKKGELYYSNEITDKDIIAKVSYSSSNDIIDNSNFVFDNDTYKDLLPSKSSSHSSNSNYDDYHLVLDNNGDYTPVRYDCCSEEGSDRDKECCRTRERRLYSTTIYGNSEYTAYIEKRFKDDINRDKSYRKLCNDIYGGKYLGFKDYSNLEKFTSLDLYNLYFISFPNKAAEVFCYFLAVIFTGMIIYSIVRLRTEEGPKSFSELCEALIEQSVLTSIYIIFFVGFFLYIIYEYDNIYNKLRHEELLEIKADPFFEDLLQEIYDRNPKSYLMFLFMGLYVLSLIIYDLAWILNYRFGLKHKYF